MGGGGGGGGGGEEAVFAIIAKISVSHSINIQVLTYTKPCINPIALRKAKTACNFCLSECNRFNKMIHML